MTSFPRSAEQAVIVDHAVIDSEPSAIIRSDQVEMAVSLRGAMLAPVTFYRRDPNRVRPYFIAPWSNEPTQGAERSSFRGDFFCMPYGSNANAFRGEQHPSHGETARARWELAGARRQGLLTMLSLSIEPKVRRGKVTRELNLIDGHNVIYERTVIENFRGPTTLAHHATLAMPSSEGALLVSTSRFLFGMTCPYLFSDPERGEYRSLAIGAKFGDLRSVQSIYRCSAEADCSKFPTRRGFSDLLQVFDDPRLEGPAWVAAVNTEEDYIWFALKNTKQLPSRIFWMENRGRHAPPWSGRTTCLGLEDCCAFFDAGLVESVQKNAISEQGIATYHDLNGHTPFVLPYIQGVVKVPSGFGRVKTINFGPSRAVFISEAGHAVSAPVYHEFLIDGTFARFDA